MGSPVGAIRARTTRTERSAVSPRALVAVLPFALALAPLAPAAQGPLFRDLHALEAPAAPATHPLGFWYSFRNGYQSNARSAVAVRDLAATVSGRTPSAYQTAGLIWGTPVIDDAGNVYVGSADKVFYALDPAGNLRWSYTLPDAGDALIDSAATLAPGGLVVVPGGDGTLHALDTASGAVRWTFDAYHADDHEGGATVNSFEGNVVLGPDGNLYAGSDNGHMYSLDLDGNERWNVETGMMIWSAAAFDPAGEWMTFGSLDNKVYVVRLADGEVLATYKAAGEIKSSPAVGADGRIYIGCSDFTFRALELRPGRLWGHRLVKLWDFDTRGEIYSSPALADGKVVFGSHDGYVYCLTTGGDLVWRYGIHSRISASPLVTADGVVVLGAKSGKLYALDLATGERIWSYEAAPGRRKVNLDSSPALAPDGTIFVGSYDGHVYAVPYEYALQNATDPRVSLDPGPDVPDFGGELPQDGATLRYLGDDGRYRPAPTRALTPEEGMTFAIVANDGGAYVPNAAIATSGLEVEVDPPTPVDVVVASDSYSVNVFPRPFWAPDTTYTLTVKGRWYHRRNPFVDMLKWFRLPKFEYQVSFTTGPDGAPLPPAEPGRTPRYAMAELYAVQPEMLDTLIPAALDGQAFVASFAFRDDSTGKVGVVVLPAYPRPEGVVLRPAPEKVFSVSGDLRGGSLKVGGDLRLSAMGATIPFAPFRMTGRISPEAIAGGRFHATASILGIKGNGSTYTGLSWSAIDDLADSWLKLHALGTLAGTRMPELEPALAHRGLRWTGSKAAELDVDVTGSLEGPHLVTVAFWDPAKGEVVAHASASVGTDAGLRPGSQRTLRFEGLKRSKLEDLEVALLLDGQAIPAAE